MALGHTQDATHSGEAEPARALKPVDVERYEVLEEIGEGGIGRVMRANDKRLNRQVAIKLLRKLSADHEARFFAEAEVTARLEHPAIVPVHDVGRWHTGEPFYAMKLVSGDSLKDVVARASDLDARLKLLPNVLTVCDAVAYAHSQGVIHRDLKPSNVMVGSFGETLVIDWGLAQLTSAAGDARSIAGTPHYMAPEQARGEAAGTRSDVYALGALLYEVLSGRAPFQDESDVLGKVVAMPPAPLPAETPVELAAIVGKAMKKAAAERYADALELRADLRRYLEGQLVKAHRYSAWQRFSRFVSRNKPLTVAVVVVLAIAAYSFARVVAERDAARLAESKAESSQAAEEHARVSAEQRRNQLLLAQSKLWLEKDPTVSFAWLKAFAGTTGATPREVSSVAAVALSRGVATQLVRGRKRVAFSDDGVTLAGIEGDTLVTWTRADPTPRVLGKPAAKVTQLKFEPGGRSLLVAEDTKLMRWPVQGGESALVFEAPDALSALLVEKGTLAIGSDLGGVWLQRGEVIEKVRQRAARIDSLARVNDVLAIGDVDDSFELVALSTGKTIASGRGDGLALGAGRASWGTASGDVVLLEVATGKRQTFKGEHQGVISETLLTPDGRLLLSMGQDHQLGVRDLVTGKRRLFAGSGGWLLHGMLSKDGTLALTVGQDHVARVWNLENGTAWELLGHAAPFRTFGFFGENDAAIVTGDGEGEVRLWKTPRPRSRALLEAHASQYEEARFLPDGRIVTAGEDAKLNVWTPETNELLTFSEPNGGGGSTSSAAGVFSNSGAGGAWVRQLADARAPALALGGIGELHQGVLSRDGKRLATAGADHQVRVFELPSGQGRIVGAHPAAVWHVAFSPDTKWLASTGDDLPVRLWPLGPGEPKVLEGPEAVVFDLQFSPDGRWLAAGGVDAKVRVWSVPGFEPRALQGHGGLVRQLAFSPDSALLATASDDHTVRVWQLGGSAAPLVLEHAAQLASVVFSSDGSQVVSADDRALYRWDAKTGVLLSVSREHLAAHSGLSVSPDGRALVSAAEDHAVRFWPGFFADVEAVATAAALEAQSSVRLRDDVAVSSK